MDYNNQNTFATVLRLFLVGMLFIACMGCDSILSDEFKAKNFTATDVDVSASNLLSRDTINDAQGNTISYQYYPITSTRFRILDSTKWMYANASALTSFATQSDTTDSKIIYAHFDAIVGALNSIPSDSLVIVKYPAGQAVSYAVLRASTSKDVHIYTSLQYYWTNTASNINDYVTVEIIKRDTTLVSGSRVISPEDANCSLENILVNGASTTLRTINARLTAHVDQGVYLIRFTLSNPVSISNPLTQPASVFHLPSIARQFKVVIL
jgi:hypothetical protein